MTTYRNVTLTVTYVMEYTEECLTVFGSMSMLCYTFIFGYLAPGPRQQDFVNLIYKRIQFQSDI